MNFYDGIRMELYGFSFRKKTLNLTLNPNIVFLITVIGIICSYI